MSTIIKIVLGVLILIKSTLSQYVKERLILKKENLFFSGEYRSRTDDLLNANQVL